MPKFVHLATFRRDVRAGRKPKVALRLAGTIDTSAQAADDSRVVRFVFSDSSVDRYGDTVSARGWKLENYRANPVVLFGHNDKEVRTVVGKTVNIFVEGDKLVGDIEFMTADISPEADVVFKMVKGGYLNAVSVGFQPLEWAAAKDKSRPMGIDFRSQDLLETSIVPVPALPTAIAMARAAGIDVDRLKLLRDAPAVRRGLYEVSWLASLLSELGYMEEWVEWEAENEGDNSAVPAMLAEALKQLGAALISMTIEEVAELLGDTVGEAADGTTAQKTLRSLGRTARAAKSGRHTIKIDADVGESMKVLLDRIERAGAVLQVDRAGKTISAATESEIRAACGEIEAGNGGVAAAVKRLMALIEPASGESAAAAEEKAAKEVRVRKARAIALSLEAESPAA